MGAIMKGFDGDGNRFKGVVLRLEFGVCTGLCFDHANESLGVFSSNGIGGIWFFLDFSRLSQRGSAAREDPG